MGLAGFRRYATKFFVGTLHFLAHLTAMFTLSLLVVTWNNQITPTIQSQLDALYKSREAQAPIVREAIRESLEPLQRRTEQQQQRAPQEARAPSPARQLVGFVSYPILMISLGALVGGSLWGLYWVLTGVFGRMHAEDAFAALRITNYKNFLRLKFERDRLTIYPLGIDKIPRPDDWLNTPPGKDNPLPHNPKLMAVKPIDVRLIENPIVIDRTDEKAD